MGADRYLKSFVTGYVLSLSFLLPLHSKAQNPAPPTAQTEPLAVPHNAQTFKFTKVDRELLRQVNAFDKYIEERGWVYHEAGITDYLEKVGLTLVPKQTPENVQWRFRVIRDLEVNAFALPNGSVYVNSGLIARMENEAQLAGVLAHEITHVVNRHTFLENRSSRKKMVVINLMLAAARAAYFSGVDPLIVEAMRNLVPLLVVSTIFGYSRELEHEADVYAVNTLYQRGYDLREFSRGFDLLRRGPEVELSREPVFWASHPKLTDRIEYLTTMGDQLQPSGTGLLVNRGAYSAATGNVIRNNAAMAILLGRPRTALANALRLTTEDPNNPESYVLLGDAYRNLGARTPRPESAEQTNEAKEQTRGRLKKMTMAEYDKALLEDERGPARWQANWSRSEKAFHKALEMDPHSAAAHRGLGYLFESNGAFVDAVAEFKTYLELAPEAKDARQIRLHLETLQHSSAAKPEKSARAQ